MSNTHMLMLETGRIMDIHHQMGQFCKNGESFRTKKMFKVAEHSATIVFQSGSRHRDSGFYISVTEQGNAKGTN